MSSITAQQIKLDLELVPNEKRLDIVKCNRRLNPGKIQREPTFQVVLDDLALIPCFSAFLIIVDVLEVYMHQFWDFVYKLDTFYRFKMDKRKRFKLNLEIFRDIFKICPRVQGQDFDALPTDEEIVVIDTLLTTKLLPIRNMNPIASQQAALDNSLVAPEKRLKIERCNARIVTKPQKKKHTSYIGISQAIFLLSHFPDHC
ncbi:hypothetical protein Tco_0070784 [Tanacetum coccineum]